MEFWKPKITRDAPKLMMSEKFQKIHVVKVFFLSQLEVIPIKYMKKPIKQWRMEWKKMEKFLLLNVWIIAMLANYTHEGRSRRRQRRRQKKKKNHHLLHFSIQFHVNLESGNFHLWKLWKFYNFSYFSWIFSHLFFYFSLFYSIFCVNFFVFLNFF